MSLKTALGNSKKHCFLRDLKICQNRSRNTIFSCCCFFVRLLAPPILKHFLIIQAGSLKLCMQRPNNIPLDYFFEKPRFFLCFRTIFFIFESIWTQPFFDVRRIQPAYLQYSSFIFILKFHLLFHKFIAVYVVFEPV